MSTTAPSPTAEQFEEEPQDKELTPYEAQRPFLGYPDGTGQYKSSAQYHAFVSGIGAGKTTSGVIRMLLNVKQWNVGQTGYVIAPTHAAIRNVILPELRKWNVLNHAEYNRSNSSLEFPNGSKVIFESADNKRKIERLRGPSISWFWIDEAASLPEMVWDVMKGRLRGAGYRNAFITTTPQGRNWVYQHFHPDGQQYVGPDRVNGVFNVGSDENPHLPDDYLEMIDDYEGKFHEQEVQGMFVSYEGLVYPWFTQGQHTTELPAMKDLRAADIRSELGIDRVIYGVDWGFSAPSVILALVERGNETLVAEEFVEKRCTTDDLVKQAEEMQSRWGNGVFYCDPAEPSSIEEFQRKGIDAEAANNSRREGIRHVSAQQDTLTVAESCQTLVNEFGQYQYRDKNDGSEQVIKANDHALDALRYALYTDHEQRQTKNSFNSLTW